MFTKNHLDENTFCEGLKSVDSDAFSDAGRRSLYRHYEQIEKDVGDEIEIDFFFLRDEFVEHENALAAAQGYRPDIQTESEALEYLLENTVVMLTGSRSTEGVIIWRDFL